MPFRLDEFRAKVQFTTSARMPNLVYQACVKTGVVSNTVYYQHAVCEKLSRDLNIPLEDLLADLPPPRYASGRLFDGHRKRVPKEHKPGPAGTNETVK